MNRRDAGLALLVGPFAFAVASLAVNAQSAAKIRRIGYLTTGWAGSGFDDELRGGLRELGWVVGQNLLIEYRFAEGRYDRLPALAAELVRLNVEVIVAAPTPAAVAASKATRTIPVVMSNTAEPVGLGLVASLARPGGNVTGTAYSVGVETLVKGLDLLKEAIPKISRVAVLSNPANPAQALVVRDLKNAAPSLGLSLIFVEARSPDEIDRVFAKVIKDRVDALLVVAESLFLRHATTLADLALKYALPSMHGIAGNVTAGGLMSYGPNLSDATRRAAIFVDKILKGAEPADLPVEQPTTFQLVINLKTARALNITIPQSLLLRAHEVIQ